MGLAPTQARITARIGAGKLTLGDGAAQLLDANVVVAASDRHATIETAEFRIQPRPAGPTTLLKVSGTAARNDGRIEAALSVALDDLRPFLAGGASATPPALTLVLGIMADKDVDGMLRALATPVLRGATVVATAVGLPRALPATQLAAAWAARHPGGQVIVEPDVPAAVERALRIAPGPVVVAGSLYLVGQARALLMPDPLLADPGAPIMGR